MHVSIAAENIFEIAGIPISNSTLATGFVVIILGIVAYLGTRKMEVVPSGLQNLLELAVEKLHNLTQTITGKERLAAKIFPLVATFFIFILISNWMGLLPGFGSIGFNELNEEGHQVLVPFLRAGTADLNTTFALALISVFTIQFVGITAVGLRNYSKKFFNFSSPVMFFVGILELVSEIIKIVSFSFRLFGNVFAGEVLLIVIATLVPYIIPMPFYAMEIFVGFIQSLVFTMLTLVFIKMATVSHGSHEENKLASS